jgi:transcriptional regulator with XRE-family HTH domain
MTPLRIRIKELREGMCLSQEKLAELASVSRATISRLENGHPSSIDLAVLERIAQVLGAAPGSLIAEVERPLDLRKFGTIDTGPFNFNRSKKPAIKSTKKRRK